MSNDITPHVLKKLSSGGLPETVSRPKAALRAAPYPSDDDLRERFPDRFTLGYEITGADGTTLGWIRVDSARLFTVIDYDGAFKRREGGALYAIRQFPSLDAAADFASNVLAPELAAGRKVPRPPERMAMPPKDGPEKYGHARGLTRAAEKALAAANVTGWRAVVNGRADDDALDGSTDDEVSFVDAEGRIHPVSIQSGPYGHGVNRSILNDLGELSAVQHVVVDLKPSRFPTKVFVDAFIKHMPAAEAAA